MSGLLSQYEPVHSEAFSLLEVSRLLPSVSVVLLICSLQPNTISAPTESTRRTTWESRSCSVSPVWKSSAHNSRLSGESRHSLAAASFHSKGTTVLRSIEFCAFHALQTCSRGWNLTLRDATLLFLSPHFPAQSFESRPELALAHDGNCLPGSPDSSRSLLHLQWKWLFLLRSARPNLISASRSQPARRPPRRSHLVIRRDHFMGKVEKPEVCYQARPRQNRWGGEFLQHRSTRRFCQNQRHLH